MKAATTVANKTTMTTDKNTKSMRYLYRYNDVIFAVGTSGTNLINMSTDDNATLSFYVV